MQQTDLNPPRENAYLSQSFLARVRRAYKIALDTWGSKNSKIWGAIDQRRAPVHAALLAETDADLRDIFANPVSSELFLGVDFLCDSILGQVKKLSVGSAKDIANEGRNLTVFAGHAVKRLDEQGIADHLDEIARTAFLSFTKLIGAENEADDASIDAEKALKLVDRQLDQTVLFPNPFPGELGMVTSRGIASYRAICALYHAWRIRLLLPKCAEKSVIEIGPGLGRTAYYAYRAGVTDYTTVDLPMGIVAQACFLGAALGPEKILLPGDNERIAEGRVKLLVAGDQAYRKYGVVFNSELND